MAEVWVAGWHVCFQDGSEPDAPARCHPPPDAEAGPGEAEVEITAQMIAVRRGDWMVLLREDRAEVVLAKPTTSDVGGLFLRRLGKRRA